MTEEPRFPDGFSADQSSASGQSQTESGLAITAQELTAGELLRNARQAQGMEIDVLASILKVPAAKIEALENNQHGAFPDAVFVRALASSMCRVLATDNARVLALLPQGIVPDLRINPQSGQTRFQPADLAPRPFARLSLSRFSLLAAMVFVLAAGVVLVMPDVQLPSRTVDESIGQVKSFWHKLSGAVSSGQAPEEAELPQQAMAPPETAAANAISSQTASSPLPYASAPLAPAVAVAPELVVLRARSESWVEVVDAKKAVVLRRVLEAGESVNIASEVLPLSVVVGRADAVEVMVRGENYELAVFSKNNVARFEVK